MKIKVYRGEEADPLAFCKATVIQLGLPPFLVIPVIDNSFRSHL